MLNRISDTILNRFPLFILGYFILQVVVRLIATDTVVIDESEQVMLSQYFALGYNSQPPLYTWLQKLVFMVVGENIFAISILKNTTLLAIYLFTYKTCLLISKDKKKSALSAFGLFFLPQLIWEAQIDQIHTVLLTASAAALFYMFFYTVEKQNLRGFFFLGVACACGILAKYNFVVVIGALFISMLFIQDYREKLLNKKLLVSIIVTIGLTAPHFTWFFANMGLATSETMDRMSMDKQGSYLSDILHGSGELIVSYIAFTVIFLLFFFILFRKQGKFTRNVPVNLLLLYTLTTFVSIFIVILITQSTNIKERWLQPFLFLTPVLAFLMMDMKEVTRKRINIYIATGLTFCAIVLVVIPLRVAIVDTGKKPHRENYPFVDLSKEIKKAGFDQGLILTEDKFVGGNLKLQFQDSMVITPSIPLQKFNPAETTLVVWRKNNPLPYLEGIDLGTSSGTQEITVPYKFSKKFNCTYTIEIFSTVAR